VNLKKLFLYMLIASVAFSALLGIGVILFGDFGELATRVLLTALTITVTSIYGLACGAYLETGRGKILPLAGIFFALVSAVLWIILIWSGTIQEEFFVKPLMTSTLLGAACSLLSLLSLARLEKKFQWSYHAVHAAVGLLVGISLFIIWAEYDPSDNWLARFLGVLAVVVAALTVVTPVFHWLSRKSEPESIDAEIARLKARIEELEKQKASE
jgi:hypothetical protein